MSNLPADEPEEMPTLRTRPKLLVLRSVANAAESPASRPTNHGSDPAMDASADTPRPALRLRVVRGLRINVEYPLYEGTNVIGRSDDKPVDIDLRDQEPLDRVWASRNHAVVTVADGSVTIEDLGSTNGTYVNRHRLPPGTKRKLKPDDVIQVGTTQLKVTA
jgi:hypothetical protein